MGCTNLTDVSTICVVQGEDETFEITVLNAASTAYDLTAVKIYFTVKKDWRDDTAVISKATVNAGGSDSQILVLPQSGATKGKAQIYLVPADTDGLTDDDVDNANHWVYDIWLVTVAGKHKAIRRANKFEILPRVTVLP